MSDDGKHTSSSPPAPAEEFGPDVADPAVANAAHPMDPEAEKALAEARQAESDRKGLEAWYREKRATLTAKERDRYRQERSKLAAKERDAGRRFVQLLRPKAGDRG